MTVNLPRSTTGSLPGSTADVFGGGVLCLLGQMPRWWYSDEPWTSLGFWVFFFWKTLKVSEYSSWFWTLGIQSFQEVGFGTSEAVVSSHLWHTASLPENCGYPNFNLWFFHPQRADRNGDLGDLAWQKTQRPDNQTDSWHRSEWLFAL